MRRRDVVAWVALIAHQCRQQELAPLLKVQGEPVDYGLELIEPANTPAKVGCDVIVIDGGSFVDADERGRVLRRVGQSRLDGVSTIYVSSRLPCEREIEEAWFWVDDLIEPGWRFGERLRRRVQTLALAPWRHSRRVRLRAERAGALRLCVFPRPRSSRE